MTVEEFRMRGYQAVDWICDYMENIEKMPVLSTVKPGEIRAQLPSHPPKSGEPFDQIFKDVTEIILPGVTHWQSPNFFAFFPANTSGPSILGEMLSAGLGVQGMLWTTSPACTELETHVLDWLVEMLDLPKGFSSQSAGGGVIQDTASSATLCALLAARDRPESPGGSQNAFAVYASTQAHSSVEKAVRISGIPTRNLRLIDVDSDYALRVDSLAQAMRADIEAELKPGFVCATVGTTSSNAMDPLREIGDLCRKYGAWLHVDAAMSGTAAVCPEFRYIHKGLELADSYCFNPHKWMFVNFDCDCFYVSDRKALVQSLSILPEYLRNRATESGQVIDYRDWQVPLGRRFRALKLWAVIRHYGIEGLQHHVREHVRLAQRFMGWVDADDQFEVAAPAPLNLICFRHKGGDAFNLELMEKLNASGRLYLVHTKLDGQVVLRFCVGQTYTRESHVENAWSLIRETAKSMES